MDISKLSYSDFEPIIVIGRETAIVVVAADSKYNTIEELITDAKENPNKINTSIVKLYLWILLNF